MAKQEALMLQLEQEYCPPLDPSLFRAIAFDYDDVTDPEIYRSLTQQLDSLKEGAELEDAGGFDPSGSGGRAESRLESQESQSGHGSRYTLSSNTDDTNLSQRIASLDLEGSNVPSPGYGTPDSEEHELNSFGPLNSKLDGLDPASQQSHLIEIFPNLTPFTIRWILDKSKGYTEKALDELLNTSFLEETSSRPRGVDGFSESEVAPKHRKGKGKKNRPSSKMPSSTGAEPLSSSPAPKDRWKTAQEEIDFIVSKTNTPESQIKSIYNNHGATIPQTLNFLIAEHIRIGMQSTSPKTDTIASNLAPSFPSIPPARLRALIELTDSSPSSSHDLATALIARPASTPSPIQIIYQLPPPDLTSSFTPTKPAPPSTSSSRNKTTTSSLSHSGAAAEPDFHSLRNAAFASAAAASRRSRSDHLMGGAAAYYSQEGRDLSVRAALQESERADRLVAAQSGSWGLDLHGVTVKDGVRIAREGVENWWIGERAKERGGRGGVSEFKIVTGRGVHSEGGRGKLGPAVAKMLIGEGWKVRVGSGDLVVTGVVGGVGRR